MAKRLLVTGGRGFLGKNLVYTLKNKGYQDIDILTRDSSEEEFRKAAESCDFVFHLAGVNRPQDPEEFMEGNAGLTEKLIRVLRSRDRAVPVLLTSSVQAGLLNPYGASKRAAEEIVFLYGRERDVPVYVYRLPNVFGKWSRPDYNTVVATFCHRIARDLPVEIHDPAAPLSLTYVDDVMGQFLRCLETGIRLPSGEFVTYPPRLIYELTVGRLAELIRSFRDSRREHTVPELGDELTAKLYSTYLSFLPEEGFSNPLETHADERGSFTEFLRTPDRGQVSVNISRPGITKGQHWHHSKNEKFLVVRGEAEIRFRKIGTEKIITYRVSGEKLEAVDIPTGYTHSITNVGDGELVTVMWASEAFDPGHPDTWHEEV